MSKSGDNIIQKIDWKDIANQFVTFYYLKQTTAPNELFTLGTINEYTRFNFNGKILTYMEIYPEILALYEGPPVGFTINNVQSLESGSRRIDILVIGTISKGHLSKQFSQSFILTYHKNTWKIQNSILNFFI